MGTPAASHQGARDDTRTALDLKHHLPFIGILVGCICTWICFGFWGRSISTDDGISILAAEGFASFGIPKLPSGFIYDRGYLAHAIVGASIFVFGTNDVGILLPSLLFSAATLVFVYKFSCFVLPNSSLRLLPPLAVGLCATTLYYATSPRMYGFHAFFCTYAAYAALRGYARNEVAHRWRAIAAIGLGLLCERGAGTLLLALVVGVIVQRKVHSGQSVLTTIRSTWRELAWREWVSIGGVALALALSFWPVHNAIQPMVAEAGQIPVFLHFNASIERLLWHLQQFDGMLPGTAWFIPVACLMAYTSENSTRATRLFLLSFAAVAFLQTAFVLRMVGHRFLSFLLPLYAVIATLGIDGIVKALRRAVPPKRAAYVLWTSFAGAAVFIWLLSYGLNDKPLRIAKSYKQGGYGFPSTKLESNVLFEHILEKFRSQWLRAGDRVLSANPWVHSYYVGDIDGMVRQRREEEHFSSYTRRHDEYFGVPLIDSTDAFIDFVGRLEDETTVWLLWDYKLDHLSSTEFRFWLKQRFDLVDSNPVLGIYRARPTKTTPSETRSQRDP